MDERQPQPCRLRAVATATSGVRPGRARSDAARARRVSSRSNWTFSARNRTSPVADVEREERRSAPHVALQLADQLVHDRERAAGERLRPGRVGGVEVARPRFDHREPAQGGSVRSRPRRSRPRRRPTIARPDAVRDRAEVRVDVAAAARSTRRSTSSGPTAPVEVLGIGVVVTRALWDDEDRRPRRRERVEQPVVALVRRARSGQAVQEVHDRVAAA